MIHALGFIFKKTARFYYLDCPIFALIGLILPKIYLIVCTFTFTRLTAISVYSPNNSSLTLYPSSAHQVLASGLTQLCARCVAKQIYKAIDSENF